MERQNREFLLDGKTISAVNEIILGNDINTEEFKNDFRQVEQNCAVHNQVIATNTEGEVLFTSFGESQLSSYLVNYNNAVCYNARNCGEEEIYRAVYYDWRDCADTLFIKPVFINGIARWMAKSMAENNAAAIGQLASEIRLIRNGDYNHRIQINTDNEFDEVGYQVNNMLDSIRG